MNFLPVSCSQLSSQSCCRGLWIFLRKLRGIDSGIMLNNVAVMAHVYCFKDVETVDVWGRRVDQNLCPDSMHQKIASQILRAEVWICCHDLLSLQAKVCLDLFASLCFTHILRLILGVSCFPFSSLYNLSQNLDKMHPKFREIAVPCTSRITLPAQGSSLWK